MRLYWFPDLEDLDGVIYRLASEFYPDYPDAMPAFQYMGEQGKGRLESALAGPRQTFGGLYLHRTIFDKAAALFRSMVANHGLIDGNKRLALATVAVFLTRNGYLFYVPREEAVMFALRLASPEDRPSLNEVSRWLRRHSITMSSFESKTPAEKERWLETTQETARAVIRVILREVEEIRTEVAELTRSLPEGKGS